MFGTLVLALRALFATRGAERGPATIDAAVPPPSSRVALPGPGVSAFALLRFDDGARAAVGGAFERHGAAADTAPGCSSPGVSCPFADPSFFEARLAARPALHGRTEAATDTASAVPANLPAPPRPLPRASAFDGRIFAAISHSPSSGRRVSVTIVPALPLTARRAERAARLGFGPAAFGAKSLFKPSGCPAPIPPSLGGAGLVRILVPRDAGGAPSGGPGAIGEAFLLCAIPANGASGYGRPGAASRTQSLFNSLGDSPAMTLTVERSSFVGVLDGHGLSRLRWRKRRGRTAGARPAHRVGTAPISAPVFGRGTGPRPGPRSRRRRSLSGSGRCRRRSRSSPGASPSRRAARR